MLTQAGRSRLVPATSVVEITTKLQWAAGNANFGTICADSGKGVLNQLSKLSRGGIVRDIRTGRAIGRTKSLSETFVQQVLDLLTEDRDFYIVFGRCRHLEVREVVDELRTLEGFQVLYDPQMPADTIWLFDGDPEELGFAV